MKRTSVAGSAILRLALTVLLFAMAALRLTLGLFGYDPLLPERGFPFVSPLRPSGIFGLTR